MSTATSTAVASLGQAPPRRKGRGANAVSWFWTLVFVGPNVVLFGVFMLVPVLAAFALSLFEWDLISPPRFVGFQHYVDMFGDPRAFNSFVKTIYLVLLGVVPTVILSFVLAVLINTQFALYRVFRTFYLLPIVISFVASAVLWRFVFDARVGPVNAFLGWLGINGPNWLQDPFWAMPAVSIVIIWLRLPLGIILYLAALQQINQNLLEAANIDGATSWQKMRYIIWPSVRPMTFLVLIITLRGVMFESFDVIQVMTDGGPLRATDIFIKYIYDAAFEQLRMGYASAMATLLFIVVAGLAMIFTPPRASQGARR